MLSHIDQRGDRSVRRRNQIDLVVAESGSDFIQIVHGDWRCIQRKVRDLLQFLATLPHLLSGEERANELLEVGRIVTDVADAEDWIRRFPSDPQKPDHDFHGAYPRKPPLAAADAVCVAAAPGPPCSQNTGSFAGVAFNAGTTTIFKLIRRPVLVARSS